MIDSTRLSLPKESNAERPKPTVSFASSAWRPRWTPTSTLSARSFIAQPPIFCQRQGRTPAGSSPTLRWSRSAWPRRSWASPATGASCAPPGASSATCSRSCPVRPATSSVAAASPAPSCGCSLTSPRRVPAPAMTCCSSTRTRSSVAAAARRPSARPSGSSPATATALPTRAGSGACACTCWPRPTVRRGRSPWAIRGAMSVRSASSCWPVAAAPAAGCSSATRATPAVSSRLPSPSWAPPWCARRARTSPAAGRTWSPSASASSRSSGPARTCSPWNATGPVPWPACVSASWRASFAWQPASASTTGSGARAVPWSTTAPEGVGVASIIYMGMCSTMTPGSDIFVGFIETGLRSLKRGGVLSFIVADRWMHNSYGRRLRGLVADCYAVEAVCEMHGVNAFAEDVSAYPAITQIRRSRQGEAMYAAASERFDAVAAQRLMSWVRGGTERSDDPDFRATRLPGWFHTEGMWPSASPERIALLETLNDAFMPLEDQATGTRVGIGIATGADDVFVTGDEFLVEHDRMLPLVTTAHIKSGHLEGHDKWLVNPWDDAGRLVELGAYPRLESYLSTKAERLARRHIAQKSPADWYRTIDKVYPGLRGAPKLLLADMKATIQPVLDPGFGYPHHNLYWITSAGWDLEVLGGILLSRVAQMFVEAYGVKMRGGTLRFQAQYLRLIRVPAPGSVPPALAARLKRAFQTRDVSEATAAALETYGLRHLPD